MLYNCLYYHIIMLHSPGRARAATVAFRARRTSNIIKNISMWCTYMHVREGGSPHTNLLPVLAERVTHIYTYAGTSYIIGILDTRRIS